MAGYAASNLLGGTQQAIASTFKTLLNLSASNATLLRRGFVFEFVFGADGTPADNVMTFDVSRTTAVGTATAVTPNPLQSADGACVTVANANHTSEPTVTANSSLWGAGINQRATSRWVAFPGQELVIPATNLAGLAFRAKSPGYTGTATVQVEFTE
jgi:hypothetical protein